MPTEAKEGRAHKMNCPDEHGGMKISRNLETIVFRGKQLQVLREHYVCPVCGIRVDDLPLAARNQKALSDAYRKSMNLLSGDEIVKGRKQKGWSQEDLTKAINVGIASIKRWEKGQIQTRPMDDALRRAFNDGAQSCDPYTGNRVISLARIKLVLQAFSERLGRNLLIKGDRLLYAAKYLWYSDMIAFRELGQSMTGATYAKLPHGPQLNNYSDLADLILVADVESAEPLTEHEIRIINKIAMNYPTNRSVFLASHREYSYENRKDGELIPYSDAEKLNGL